MQRVSFEILPSEALPVSHFAFPFHRVVRICIPDMARKRHFKGGAAYGMSTWRLRDDREGLPFLPLDLRPGFSERCHEAVEDEPTEPPYSAIGAAPFPELHGADAPPLLPSRRDGAPGKDGEGEEKCIGSEQDQYTNDGWDACWRVLISNPPKGDASRRQRVANIRKFSLLGRDGHVERMNAWTHLVGALMFFVFSLVRPLTLDAVSISGRLASYSSAVLVVTFAVSTAFHTGGTVRWLAPILRMFDHGAIDVALAVACTTDTSVVTLDFKNVPWQTALDSSGMALVILVFFMYRRSVLPASDTEISWGDCALGLFHFQHADFEYGALRSAGYICLSFGFIMLIPAAIVNLSTTSAIVLIACNAMSLVLLIIGMAVDNVLVWPDVLYQDKIKRLAQKPDLLCHNRSCGCIMTSHAWWHVFSLVSVLVLTIGREVAIADTEFYPSGSHEEL